MEHGRALHAFEVSPLSEKGWAATGPYFATYCSEPLPHPLKLYAIIEDYLWDAVAPFSPRDYLNMSSLSDFCQIASTSSFLVAEAPLHIHEMIFGGTATAKCSPQRAYQRATFNPESLCPDRQHQLCVRRSYSRNAVAVNVCHG
jgi:hypothetical protein